MNQKSLLHKLVQALAIVSVKTVLYLSLTIQKGLIKQ
jgi:hypothetical protein